MMDAQLTNPNTQSKSMAEYAADLKKNGIEILYSGSGVLWAKYESSAMMRRPTFHLEPPAPHEVRQVLFHGRAAIASYLLEPSEAHTTNAWLYLCTDKTYSLDKLSPVMRRNVRRGLKELVITPLNCEQLLVHGIEAFCDTRRRTGLNDGTIQEFHRCFAPSRTLPEHVFLGAWKDKKLAAFLSITEVADWAEIGCFSADALLKYRPNETLIYSALSYYLNERKCRLVSYGLSSIQTESNATGLHKFKLKVGFEARPVHRVFIPHPFLKPFANRLTHWGVSIALHLSPGDRHLKKAEGVLASILDDSRTPQTLEKDSDESTL